MALRARHGNAKRYGVGPVVETLPADELPVPLPALAGPDLSGSKDEKGRFVPGNAIASLGGKAKASQEALAVRLGIKELVTEAPFRPYLDFAVRYCRKQCEDYARAIGGGTCGTAPSGLVAAAAMQKAWSMHLFDRAAEEMDLELAAKASRFAGESRQSLLAAFEICAREAAARPSEDDAKAWGALLADEGDAK